MLFEALLTEDAARDVEEIYRLRLSHRRRET
jgi:hypothetical protein